ncbi:GNAT family N-acetyltransferase [Vreelandella alkaliphila]|uniref:GNAT family N-acetyltransferase n=1 Tax=Gammaproteobacteria TaxID=1236 RepID=UPI000E916E12|nr:MULTISPECIES: GNAT family N-acetyltransferase [unclassified Halomonas]HBS82846.1 N-acetyltransferase [Halomonas campaniensis]
MEPSSAVTLALADASAFDAFKQELKASFSVKNGFREKSIIELEQIGIHPEAAGRGLGKQLIVESLAPFKAHVRRQGCDVGAVMVTTSEGNSAEKLYQSTLGVSRAAVISGYGAGDEVILYNASVGPERGG